MKRSNVFAFVCASFLFNHFSHAYEVVVSNEATKNIGYGEWCIRTDGELHLMQQLLRPHDIIFDVGANVGEWSLHALEVQPSIHLYSFEPLPVIFRDLQNKLSNYPNAQAFNLALSDQRGRANFCYYNETYEMSGLSSFYVREVLKADHQPPQIIDVERETLSHFCAEHGIAQIDFLKIDAEGAEWIILNGAKTLIEERRIRTIQFEYGGCYIDAKTKLEDIFCLLTGHGYSLFRIMPHGLIQITQWDPDLENFHLSNYVAIDKKFLIHK